MQNAIENNMLQNILSGAPRQVINAIKGASEQAGVSFSYLVEQAKAESSFNATAEAATSSATGLYQFIESTWMNMVDKHGSKYGIETEGKSKSEILEMRKDPKLASFMAAEFANENQAYLERNWAKGEKDIGSTELYFAHFMGASGASNFLHARDENPMQQAALLFPQAAKANKNVFYEPTTGRARSLEEVYGFFDKKFSGSDTVPTQVAGAFDIKPSAGQIADPRSSVIYKNYSAPTSRSPLYNLVSNPVEILMMAHMDLPFGGSDNKASWF